MSLLDRFAASLDNSHSRTLEDVRAYLDWQSRRHTDEFKPTEDDDADIRTFILHLRTNGAGRVRLRQNLAALEKFYAWAESAALIPSSPFDEYDFDRPLLSRAEVRRRADRATGTPEEREIARLRALNHLIQELNRAANVQTALDVSLKTLLDVMNLHSAWAFLLDDAGTSAARGEGLHDFKVGAASGLPSSLEHDAQYFLRRPPDCHCQRLLRGGRVARAVNVVECSRLDEAAEAQGDNEGLLFHASMPLLSEGKLLGILNVATEEWQLLTAGDLQFLSLVGAQVTTALERARLYDEAQRHNDYLRGELQMARFVQTSLLPRELPTLPGLQLAADWRAAREIAGDFYDVFPLADGAWGLVVADVSDKGAPAALYMAMTRSLIRSAAERQPDPARVMEEVNRILLEQSSSNFFVTVFYAVLDPAAKTLQCANAGHNPPIVRRGSGTLEQLRPTAAALGVFEDFRAQEATIALAPGDALIAYTDGVTDALNAAQESYGLDRLTATICNAPASAPDLLSYLSNDLAGFTGTAPQPDDITWLVLTANSN